MSTTILNKYRKELLKQIENIPEDDVYFTFMNRAFKTIGETHGTRTRAFIHSYLQEPISPEMLSALERLSFSEQVILAEALAPLVNYYGLGSRNGSTRRNTRKMSNRRAYNKNRTFRNRPNSPLIQYGGVNLSQVLGTGIILIGGLFANAAAAAANPGDRRVIWRRDPEVNTVVPPLSILEITIALAILIPMGYVVRHRVADRIREVIREVRQFLGNAEEFVVDPHVERRFFELMRDHPVQRRMNNLPGQGINGNENAVMAAYQAAQAAERRRRRTPAQIAQNALLRAGPTNHAGPVVSSRNTKDQICVVCQEELKITDDHPSIISVETTQRRAVGTAEDPVLCGHKYHEDCIRGVLESALQQGVDSQCPTCRETIQCLRRAHPEV